MPFFRELIGQGRSIRILQSFIRNKALPQALLFEGDEGIGKRKTAEIFAQALFCRLAKAVKDSKDEEIEPCGHCLTCRKMQDGNHPGYSVVEPEGPSIKIDQIRALQSQIVIKPFDGPKKIVLIDPAEKMNDAAANSLLKTLEEPPPYAIIILISARASALRPTLLSRCQKITFQPLSLSHVISILMEKKGWTMSEARLVAAFANGRLGEAFGLEVETARALDEDRHRLVADGDLFQAAADFGKDAEGFDAALSYLFNWFRDLLVIKSLPGISHLDPSMLLYSWRYEETKRWAAAMDSDEILNILNMLQALHHAQSRNVNRQLSLETLLLNLQEMRRGSPAAR